MEVLLLLTALLASLIDAGSGDRSARPVAGVAIVRAAEAAEAAVRSARQEAPSAALPEIHRMERKAWPRAASAPLPVAHLPFERRLE